MALLAANAPKYLVNALSNGQTLSLGTADMESMGGLSIHFADAADTGGVAFVGSLLVVVRSRVINVVADAVQWQRTPFRKIFLNGASQTDFNPVNVPLTTTSIILVPASGLMVGVQVTCASGSGALYVTPCTGESAVG